MSTESQKADKKLLRDTNAKLYEHLRALEARLLLINKLATTAGFGRRKKALRDIQMLTTPAEPKQ